MSKTLIKGNEAIVYGALAAGLRCYFGYPITPQNEVPELLSSLLPKQGGEFVQAESEVAAINMLLGASACGVRAMVSSSGPGISLMQEGISYMAGSELPGVIVNVSRGGPGLGDIGPSQGDYFQATRGGGHGDYRTMVLAPAYGQEAHDMVRDAFDLAFKYRNPVMVLADAMVGQMKEAVQVQTASSPKDPSVQDPSALDWRIEGKEGREKRLLKSVWLNNNELQGRHEILVKKYKAMESEAKAEVINAEDADLILIAFGSMGRIARAAMSLLRKQGKKIGLIRPLTLYPFPSEVIQQYAAKNKKFLVLEQNTGQMIEDVELAIFRGKAKASLAWYGIMPGAFPGVDDILDPIVKAL